MRQRAVGRVGTAALRPRRVAPSWRAGPVLAAVALVAGCGLASSQVEFVVYFTPEATEQQKDAVRNACPGVGRAVLEPRDKSDLATARTYPVRYDITKATSLERSDVIRCVSGQPGVRGISQSDSSG